MAWTVNGASTHARQLVAVFQVLCSLYRLTCVGYAQNSLQFVSHSPLIHVVGRSFCLYTDSPICSNWWFQRQMLFLVGGWMLKRRRNARCTAVADSVLMNSRTQKNLVLHSSHFVLNWRCCTALGERSSGGIWKFRTSSFKCYVHHSQVMYSSGNTDLRIWVHLFWITLCYKRTFRPIGGVSETTEEACRRTKIGQQKVTRLCCQQWICKTDSCEMTVYFVPDW